MPVSVKGNGSFIFSSKTNHLSLIYKKKTLVLEAHAYEFYYNKFLFAFFSIPTFGVKFLFNFII